MEFQLLRGSQLHCAFGDSREVGELLQLARRQGRRVDLFGHVLHPGTIYGATIAIAGWMGEALQTERLNQRLISVGEPFGREDVLSERVLAFGLRSGMADSANETVRSRRRPQQYAAIAALVLEALRPGIPLYEAGLRIPTIPSVRGALRCSTRWRAAPWRRSTASINAAEEPNSGCPSYHPRPESGRLTPRASKQLFLIIPRARPVVGQTRLGRRLCVPQ